MIRMTLVSALFRKFDNCFVLFVVAKYTQYMHIVGKYNFNFTRWETGRRLAFLPVSKAHTNKFYIC